MTSRFLRQLRALRASMTTTLLTFANAFAELHKQIETVQSLISAVEQLEKPTQKKDPP